MSSIRILRFQKEIKKLFSVIVLWGLRDERLKEATITDVELSPDLTNCKVYFSVGPVSDTPPAQMAKLLTKASGAFKKELAATHMLRVMPSLRFIYDATPARVARLDEIFRKIHAGEKAPASEEVLSQDDLDSWDEE